MLLALKPPSVTRLKTPSEPPSIGLLAGRICSSSLKPDGHAPKQQRLGLMVLRGKLRSQTKSQKELVKLILVCHRVKKGLANELTPRRLLEAELLPSPLM
jgi:hypothetical protein